MNSSSDVRLGAAIEELYRTFSCYRLPKHLTGCAHCVSDADHALLYSKRLRLLGPKELSRFAFKAMTTWGGADDFRHFLPRIFELIAADGGRDWIDPEVVFGKLPYGDWLRWPEHERQALSSFFEALWSNVLGHFPHPFDADSFLCCLGHALADLTRFLNSWQISESMTSAQHFACFVEHNSLGLNPAKNKVWSLRNAWWTHRATPANQVADWLRDPARKVDLEQAFFSFGATDSDAEVLSTAMEDLACIQSFAGM